MIVTRENFEKVLDVLEEKNPVAVDTETTGLRPYHGDELFSIVISDGTQSYYFNFENYEEITENEKLGEEHLLRLKDFFRGERLWFFHNAKYDLAILARAGIEVAGPIHCTLTNARLEKSDLLPREFSLDSLGAKLGYKKDDGPKNYLVKNKLCTEVEKPGTGRRLKNYPFNLVPWDIIVPYAEKDTEITYALGTHQIEVLNETCPVVYENEKRLLRTVYEMERHGVLIDKDFCRRALEDAEGRQKKAATSFKLLTGKDYADSPLLYKEIFAQEKWVMNAPTKTGQINPCFDAEVLETFAHPAAKEIISWIKAKNDQNYYQGFLYAADSSGVIHTSLNQHGAQPGRFSSSEPNLQNLTRADTEEEFLVRRAIIPRPGMVFHMLDYDQMEYRMMLDYAAKIVKYLDPEGVISLINQVKEGLDVHEATAAAAKIPRSEAKTANFAILYGSGVATLARNLGKTEGEARAIKDSIFRAAPEIQILIRRAVETAETRGYILTWLGRRTLTRDPKFAYRAPNYLIQGGCADVVKVAMNRVRDFLLPYATRLVLPIHDELVLEGPPEEAGSVIPMVKHLMETVYPGTFLNLTCSVEHSYKSLADKLPGVCNA